LHLLFFASFPGALGSGSFASILPCLLSRPLSTTPEMPQHLFLDGS
jgi:hypothetical protein